MSVDRRKIFEIPLPLVAHSEKYYNRMFKPFVKKYKDYIHDIYFTVDSKAFDGDAMGGSNYFNRDIVLERMIELQKETGVLVCPTYNNKYKIPTYELGDKFVEELNSLYNKGIRMFQVPFSHFMRVFKLKELFPDVVFKNTVLQNIITAQEMYNEGIAGYDIINIDRNLMRDEDELKKIPAVKKKIKEVTGRDVEFVLLANETCIGRCPIMEEHYMLNALNKDNKHGYFADDISCESCEKWFENKKELLKVTNIHPLRSEFDRMLKYIDILKLHGRADYSLWRWSAKIIHDYVKGNEFIAIKEMDVNYIYISKYYREKHIEDTKNCKIQCWNCGKCDILYNDFFKHGHKHITEEERLFYQKIQKNN